MVILKKLLGNKSWNKLMKDKYSTYRIFPTFIANVFSIWKISFQKVFEKLCIYYLLTLEHELQKTQKYTILYLLIC